MRAVSKAPETIPRTSDRSGPDWARGAAVAVGVVFLLPLGYLAWGTATLGDDLWGTLLSRRSLLPLGNSLLIATSTSAACAALGTALAWLVARTDLPGKRMWRLVLALPLVIPSFVGATALLAAFGRGGLVTFVPRLDGFWGAFAVLTLLSYPYVYLPVLARLGTMPSSFEEAARLLGSRPGRVLFRVVLPQLREAIAAGGLLVFLYALSDFGAVSLLRFDTVTRAIFSARLFDRSASLLLGLVLALLALGVAAVARTAGQRRRAVTTVGARPVVYRLGATRLPALVLTGAVAGLALAAPVAVFVSWVLRGSSTVGVGYSGIGDDLGFLAGPLVNSTVAAVAAAAAAALVVLPVAFVAARRRDGLSGAAATAVTSVFALPGLVVALAVVFWAIGAPGPLAAVYQSFPLLIFAYVLHFGAQSLQSSRAAFAAVPARFDEAARTLGVGPSRRFLTVDLPLVAPGIVVGAGLVLLSTLKELPATLLLAPIGFDTLATRIWGAAEDGFFAEVGITSLLLIALSGILTWLLVLRREVRL